jgi:transcriptional regulator with XRE-family HTH domain
VARVGPLLKDWRRRRGLSQQDLALKAQVSTRHLSYVETGRSVPSRELILHLAEFLAVPLRERNTLLMASGYAPIYSKRTLEDANEGMPFVKDALFRLLSGHEPYPALVIDRHWTLVDRNRSTEILVKGVAEELLTPPVNVLRMALHPDGMAPSIVNFGEWSGYLLRRLEQQILVAGDERLQSLSTEVRAYPGVVGRPLDPLDPAERVVVPLRIRTGDGELSLLNMVATFGTAVDVTTAERVIESFYPADSVTARILNDHGVRS